MSTKEQTKGGSLSDQEAAARAYCAARSIEVAHVVSDDFTGRVTDRPGVKQIRALVAQDPTLSAVVLTKVDRIARRAHLGLLLEDEFRRLGLTVHYTDQTFDPTPTGRFLRTSIGAVAELEGDLIAERTAAGRLHKAVSTRRMPSFAQPFGYHQVRKAQAEAIPEYAGRDGSLLEHPTHAPLVRELFARAASGETLRSLARWLTETGTRARGAVEWGPSSVRHVLHNPCYHTGVTHYRRRACEKLDELTEGGNPRQRITRRDPAEWIAVPCPPLVDRATWEAVQARLLRNSSEKSGRPPLLYLLGGCVYCGTCRTQRGLPRRCGGQRKKAGWGYMCRVCHAWQHGARLEREAVDYLRRMAQPGVLAREAAKGRARKPRKADRDTEAWRRELAALEEEEANLLAAFARPGGPSFSSAALETNLARLHARAAELSAKLASAETPPTAPVISPQALEQLAARIRVGLAAAEREPGRLAEVLQGHVRVTIWRDGRRRVEVV